MSDVTEQGFQHDFRGGDCGRVEPNSGVNAKTLFASRTAAVAAVVGVVPSMLMLASKLKLSATCALQSRG